MPDTGGKREIRQRVNSKESEVVSESKKLVGKSKATQDKTTDKHHYAEKKGKLPGSR